MNVECRCGRPTRDTLTVCDTCSDNFARALGEIPWLDEQLDVTITRASGIDYRQMGSAGRVNPRSDKRIDGDNTPEPPSADSPALGAAMQHDLYNWTAADARINLRALLVSWVKFCAEEGVRSSDPRDDLPADTLPAMSRWMMWRVDGLAFNEIGPDAVEEITSAVAHCYRLIDRPAERQYLGACTSCETGRLYARPGGEWATCNECRTALDAEAVRRRLLVELEDRLCTAAEIARLSTYLGLKAGREQVRNRINQWHKRDRIEAHPSFSEGATFRFGAVYALLVAAEYGASETAS